MRTDVTNHDVLQLVGLAETLLSQLISLPSFSKEEDRTAALLFNHLLEHDIAAQRFFNNVWAVHEHFDPSKPTLLLNSHHDTVRPGSGWTTNPFHATYDDGKMIGLGSNDAGASLVCLFYAFVALKNTPLPYNLLLALSAEEEIAGKRGIEILLPVLPQIDSGIVGEPTEMRMATAERGLIVFDCTARGVTGHAARDIGVNAIYKAMTDIDRIRALTLERVSDVLGPVKFTVTQIHSGEQHNVVPDICTFVVDCRANELYSLEEITDLVRQSVDCEVQPRSLRLRPSMIPASHPIVECAQRLGIPTFGSPTMSDQALMNFPTVKIGPGKSERSHTPNEFIYLSELQRGVSGYLEFLQHLEL